MYQSSFFSESSREIVGEKLADERLMMTNFIQKRNCDFLKMLILGLGILYFKEFKWSLVDL